MSSLVSLVEEILTQAKELDEKLRQGNIPCPSIGNDSLQSLPDDTQRLRLDLLEKSHHFTQLIRGARDSAFDIAFGWVDQIVLRIIWQYNLAAAVPIGGSATYAEIASITGLKTSLVFRTIRAALSLNIFEESEPGIVRHTAISSLLATSRGFSDLIGVHIAEFSSASKKMIEVWDRYGYETAGPESSAFSSEHDGRSFYTVLSEEPELGRRFNSAIHWSISQKAFSSPASIAEAFDWSTIDKPGSQLIDLGGSFGQMCQELARYTEHLNFIVQDLPPIVEQGRKGLPAEFHGRISFEAQDFMEPQQPRNDQPQTYLISRCLHNWSDYHGARILRGLVPVLGKGSRILIWDTVLDDKPTTKLSERFVLQQDFTMAMLFNGRERTVEEFRQLLELSDERFKIEDMNRPEGSQFVLIEVSWNG